MINDFKKINYTRRETCVVCSKEHGKPLISWPEFPLTEIYTRDRPTENCGVLDQHFHVCDHCGHAQLENVVSPSTLYGGDYFFRTGASASGKNISDSFVKFIKKTIGDCHFKTIIEIGCGDLYLLNALESHADHLIGIDPILKDVKSSNSKISLFGDFFENIDFNRFNFDDCLVVCSHTIEHVENPRTMIEKLFKMANKNTIFCFQFPGLDGLVEECRFDQIFHQHINLFSSHSFSYMIDGLGGNITAADVNPNWGTLLFAFDMNSTSYNLPVYSADPKSLSKTSIIQKYNIFQNRMNNLSLFLKSIPDDTIIGYGAALMLPVLAYHLGDGFESIKYIIDDDANKEGLYYINLQTEIKHSSFSCDFSKTTVLITAIDNTRRILPKLLSLGPKRLVTVFNSM